MSDQPDEKKCPYCAEVIKSEAVKCRFCGSKLSTRPPREPLASKYKRHEKTIYLIVLLVFILTIVVIVVATHKPPMFSFHVDKNAEAPSVVGKYQYYDKDSGGYYTLEIKEDGTYLEKHPSLEYVPDSGEEFPGVWSNVVGGKGTWNTNDYMREYRNTADSYKLTGRITTRSTHPEDTRRNVDRDDYWYITEDGSITTGMKLYEKQ